MEVHYIEEPEDQPSFLGERFLHTGGFPSDAQDDQSTEHAHAAPDTKLRSLSQEFGRSPAAARCLATTLGQKARSNTTESRDALQKRPSRIIWNEAEEDVELVGQPPISHQVTSQSIRSQESLPLNVLLADLAQSAPERAAENMVERLQQACLKEALEFGTTSHVADMHFDGITQQDFVDRIAKNCVTKVEECGFEKVEWWDGRGWRESRGRYNVLHDVVYDRYYARVRVEWQTSAATKSAKRRFSMLPFSDWKRVSGLDSLPLAHSFSAFIGVDSSTPAMQDLHEMLLEQHQDLKEWSGELTRRANHTAEAKDAAEKAGRDFQESLKNFFSQPATEHSL